MRPQKLSREQIIQQCIPVLKQHGYHATSIAMLAQACGLTKGAFYYYYTDKTALVADIIKHVHQLAMGHLFTFDPKLSVLQSLAITHQKAVSFFKQDSIGCLIAIIAVESVYTTPELVALARAFFTDWQQRMQALFEQVLPQTLAYELSRQMVADYEGAILMARIFEDTRYIEAVYQRLITTIEAYITT